MAAGQDTTPIWAPDSRGLLFNRTASLADSAKDLWRIDLAAGSAPRSLTASSGFTDQYTATAWHVPIAPVAVASAAAADRAGPGVVLQGLSARARTGRRSRLQFSVYDRSGVAAADVAIDGGRPRTLRRQSDFKRLVRRLTRGPHRLRFRTRDGAGNRRTTTLRLTLR